jgi:endonuclease/exonuclease/phosphatase family metal-dependent hydrolase
MAGRGAGLSDWEWRVCEDIFPPAPLIFLGDFNCTPTHDSYARR